jgi:hypothetical protein
LDRPDGTWKDSAVDQIQDDTSTDSQAARRGVYVDRSAQVISKRVDRRSQYQTDSPSIRAGRVQLATENFALDE